MLAGCWQLAGVATTAKQGRCRLPTAGLQSFDFAINCERTRLVDREQSAASRRSRRLHRGRRDARSGRTAVARPSALVALSLGQRIAGVAADLSSAANGASAPKSGSISAGDRHAGCRCGRQASVIRQLGWRRHETRACRPTRQRRRRRRDASICRRATVRAFAKGSA